VDPLLRLRGQFLASSGPFGGGLCAAAPGGLSEGVLQQQDARGLLQAGQAAGADGGRLELQQVPVLEAHVLDIVAQPARGYTGSLAYISHNNTKNVGYGLSQHKD